LQLHFQFKKVRPSDGCTLVSAAAFRIDKSCIDLLQKVISHTETAVLAAAYASARSHWRISLAGQPIGRHNALLRYPYADNCPGGVAMHRCTRFAVPYRDSRAVYLDLQYRASTFVALTMLGPGLPHSMAPATTRTTLPLFVREHEDHTFAVTLRLSKSTTRIIEWICTFM
jgi:hypothetical protein